MYPVSGPKATPPWFWVRFLSRKSFHFVWGFCRPWKTITCFSITRTFPLSQNFAQERRSGVWSDAAPEKSSRGPSKSSRVAILSFFFLLEESLRENRLRLPSLIFPRSSVSRVAVPIPCDRRWVFLRIRGIWAVGGGRPPGKDGDRATQKTLISRIFCR